jgi:hypothetical protein
MRDLRFNDIWFGEKQIETQDGNPAGKSVMQAPSTISTPAM